MPSHTVISSTTSRSLVRVKALILFAVFLSCGVALKVGTPFENTLLALAGTSAVLLYFVRCEWCKSSIYYVKGGKHTFPVGTVSFRFLSRKKCPYCAGERI